MKQRTSGMKAGHVIRVHHNCKHKNCVLHKDQEEEHVPTFCNARVSQLTPLKKGCVFTYKNDQDS